MEPVARIWHGCTAAPGAKRMSKSLQTTTYRRGSTLSSGLRGPCRDDAWRGRLRNGRREDELPVTRTAVAAHNPVLGFHHSRARKTRRHLRSDRRISCSMRKHPSCFAPAVRVSRNMFGEHALRGGQEMTFPLHARPMLSSCPQASMHINTGVLSLADTYLLPH